MRANPRPRHGRRRGVARPPAWRSQLRVGTRVLADPDLAGRLGAAFGAVRRVALPPGPSPRRCGAWWTESSRAPPDSRAPRARHADARCRTPCARPDARPRGGARGAVGRALRPVRVRGPRRRPAAERPGARLRAALDLAAALPFVWAIAAELGRRPRPDAVLAHMVPLFLVLAAPLAGAARVRLALWYTHWHAGRTLRIATRLAATVARASTRARSPLSSPKVRGSAAIDVELFDPSGARCGRASAPARPGPHGALEGVRDDARGGGAGSRVRSRRGARAARPAAGRGRARTGLSSSGRLRLAVMRDRVRIEEPVPRDELPPLLRSADALPARPSHATARRSTRLSTRLRPAACRCSRATQPSTSFSGACRSSSAARDAHALADRPLHSLPRSPRCGRSGAELRRQVVANHSLESWVDGVAAAVTDQTRE